MNLHPLRGRGGPHGNCRVHDRQRPGRCRRLHRSPRSAVWRVVETLLGTQWYPADNPRPYDDTGWFIPGLRNVKSYAHCRQNGFRQADDARGGGLHECRARSRAPGSTIVIDHTTDNTLMTFRFTEPDVKMSAAERPFELGGHQFAAGAFIIPNANRAALEPQIREFGLLGLGHRHAARCEHARPRCPADRLHPLVAAARRTRAGSGWRFDKVKMPYTYFGDNLVRQGDLRAKYDVIIYPHTRCRPTPRACRRASRPRTRARRSRRTSARRPTRPTTRAADSARDGLRELAKFVSEGGVADHRRRRRRRSSRSTRSRRASRLMPARTSTRPARS